ncbi:MAG: AAA family ATPase, partial [Bacilli bacterium]|nr:AAA family ATPase [Bacilli bacterium]
YYRDNNDLECDAIIHLDNGKWGAIEVKLGGNEAQDEAARNLLKIKNIVDEKAMGSPSFLMILTGTKYAFKREDGVLVVPLGCLKD